jgi:Aspartyl protease
MRRYLGPRFVDVVLAAVLANAAAHADARAGPLADVKFSSPGHQVVVKVKLGKQGPFSMLLDTGTDRSVIDATLANRLYAMSVAAARPGQGKGAGVDPAPAHAWDMIGLRLGGLRADTVAAAALDLGRVSGKLGVHLDGVLGYSFLRDWVVQIDYRRQRVRFYRDPPTWTGSESVEFEMILDPEDPTPRFTGRVNRREVALLYDSGSSRSIGVAGRAIEFLGLKAAFEAAASDSAVGRGGRAGTREGRLPLVEIGQIRFTNVPCVFEVEGYGESWDRREPAGKIGGALLEGVAVTLDYPRRTIRFER